MKKINVLSLFVAIAMGFVANAQKIIDSESIVNFSLENRGSEVTGTLGGMKGDVIFDKETDRVYTDLSLVQQLHTPQGTIEVSRENSRSAVLWNPWIEKSTRLSRFKADDYLTMVCLEAANVLEDKVILASGQSHTLTTHIRWV